MTNGKTISGSALDKQAQKCIWAFLNQKMFLQIYNTLQQFQKWIVNKYFIRPTYKFWEAG